VKKKRKMSRRDVPKNPVTGRYNVPKPGESRSGNKIFFINFSFFE
jgi:hypothetical protein